jgi:predicted metal-dependent peptidase
MDTAMKIKKAKSRLMRHVETRHMAGIFVSGKVEICDNLPTACTDGWNEKYGRKFTDGLTIAEATGVVLHEGLHKYAKHIPRFRKLMKTDGRMINAAMDYAINDIIHNLKDKTLAVLPEPHLYNPMFRNWSVLEIYEFLKTGRDKDGNKRGNPKDNRDGVNIGGSQYDTESMDEHSAESITGEELSETEAEEIAKKIDDAIKQGAIIAGAMGLDLPRALTEALDPVVDWTAELYDFASNNVRGADEYSFQRYNRRRIADDIYMPTMYKDTISEVLIMPDASGSIDQRAMNAWAAEIANVCEVMQPDLVRVLWWDTQVHAEQVFEPGQFDQIRDLLMPRGGGGTEVSCLSRYINDKNITADCAIVLTDGYVEPEVKWDIDIPTLWMVTESRMFRPPVGRMVKIDNLGKENQ